MQDGKQLFYFVQRQVYDLIETTDTVDELPENYFDCSIRANA